MAGVTRQQVDDEARRDVEMLPTRQTIWTTWCRKQVSPRWSQFPRVEEGEDEDEDVHNLEVRWRGIDVGVRAHKTRHAVCSGRMSMLLHKRPAYIVQAGYHVLRYLRGTTEMGLHNSPGGVEAVANIFVNASFPPPCEGISKGCSSSMLEGWLLFWESSRQSFITQSTAESELLALMALLETVGFEIAKKVLHGDNRAALPICTSQVGSLRIRSAKFRDVLAQGHSSWVAQHCPERSSLQANLAHR